MDDGLILIVYFGLTPRYNIQDSIRGEIDLSNKNIAAKFGNDIKKYIYSGVSGLLDADVQLGYGRLVESKEDAWKLIEFSRKLDGEDYIVPIDFSGNGNVRFNHNIKFKAKSGKEDLISRLSQADIMFYSDFDKNIDYVKTIIDQHLFEIKE
jgi:hypothetical protein